MKMNNQDFRIIIPTKFSRSTSEYLENISKRYTFSDTTPSASSQASNR